VLDKNSFLDLLSKAENETTVFMQQTVGKHDLIKKLIEAINTGNYDAKPENSVPQVEENITVDQV
jgi:hypothetical protein